MIYPHGNHHDGCDICTEAPVQESVNQRAHEMALRQWEHWKQYALELQERLVKYEGGSPMRLNTTPPAAPVQEPVALRDALADSLGGVYVCNRAWSAWGVGTMTQDDFYPAAESDDVLDSLVEAVAKATPPAAPVQEHVAWVWNPAQEAWERVRAFGHWQQGAIYAFGTTPPAKLGVTLTDEQKQHIHNVTGAGHALICLVESYINEAMNGGAA